ncbi:MAG: hypothetical protein AAFQ80_07900 [Cyanobacteria bacterium J06621_8]
MDISSIFSNTFLLAEIPDYAVGDALDILQNYSFVSNALAESFLTVWEGVVFNTDSAFWKATIAGGLDLALLAMLVYAWDGFKLDQSKREPYIINGVVMVLILAVLLGGNGFLVSNILKITYFFDHNLIQTLANTQLLDLSIADSLKNISLTNDARDLVDSLLDECNSLSGQESLDCLQTQAAEIEKIATAAEQNDPILNNPAAKYAKDILAFLSDIATNAANGDALGLIAQTSNRIVTSNPIMMAVLKFIFGGIQLAFNFGLEVASILHALALPLVIAVIFSPVGAKYTQVWIKGKIQLLLVKFFYLGVVGLTAEAIVRSGSQLATGVGFLIFSSVVGPALAFYMARGGGSNLAEFVSNKVSSAMSYAVQQGAVMASGGAGKLGFATGKLFTSPGGLVKRTTRRGS